MYYKITVGALLCLALVLPLQSSAETIEYAERTFPDGNANWVTLNPEKVWAVLLGAAKVPFITLSKPPASATIIRLDPPIEGSSGFGTFSFQFEKIEGNVDPFIRFEVQDSGGTTYNTFLLNNPAVSRTAAANGYTQVTLNAGAIGGAQRYLTRVAVVARGNTSGFAEFFVKLFGSSLRPKAKIDLNLSEEGGTDPLIN